MPFLEELNIWIEGFYDQQILLNKLYVYKSLDFAYRLIDYKL